MFGKFYQGKSIQVLISKILFAIKIIFYYTIICIIRCKNKKVAFKILKTNSIESLRQEILSQVKGK